MLSTFTGTMDGTHVGKATLLAQHCVNFADLLCKQGTITITAANQDVLEARYECPMGRIEEGVAHWTSHFTFVGGTGRFLHASGGALEVGSINMATGLGGSALSGDLRYVASDRRR